MKELKFKVVVLKNGRIEIENVAVREGQTVEVTVSISEDTKRTWPLWGLPVHLRDPFEPAIDPAEWESEK